MLKCWYCHIKDHAINKLETHGPHRSPEKQFQSMKTTAQSFAKYERQNHFLLFDNLMFFICKHRDPFTPACFTKCGLNWPSCSGEKVNFLKFHPRFLCAKFG